MKPELDVQSNWSRHYFDVYARAAFNEYVSHGSESTTDWDVGSDYRIDVVRGTDIKFGAEDARLTEPRTWQTSSSEPHLASFPRSQFPRDARSAISRRAAGGTAP